MYTRQKKTSRRSGECGWLRETRRSGNKMAALGYVYTLVKQTSCSPEGCISWNPTDAEFLDLRTSSCMTGILDRCLCQALEARKN